MKVTLDARQAVAAYTKAFRHLTTLPGFDPKAVLRAEAGSILKKWAGVTKVGTVQEANARARFRAGKRAFGDVGSIDANPYKISVNTGVKGGHPGEVWYRHPVSRKFQQAGIINDRGMFGPAHIHWKKYVWNDIQAGALAYGRELKTQLELAPKTIGFSRQAVVQIADALSIDLTKVQGQGISAAGIAKARAAVSSGGKSYKNGHGFEGGDRTRCYVQLLSTLPYGIKINMDTQLAVIVNNRAKFIETAYRKGAGESLAKAARAFPNILKVAA